MIIIKNFHSNLLKINKESHEDIEIYCITYIMIKKFSVYENIHSVNQLHLLIHSATGHFKVKYREKYLIIDSTEEYEKIFRLGLNQKLKRLMVEKNCSMKKIMQELELIQMMIYL